MAKQKKPFRVSDSNNPLINPHYQQVQSIVDFFKSASEKRSQAEMFNEIMFDVWVTKLLLAADRELFPFLNSVYKSDKSVLRTLLESCIDLEIDILTNGEYQVVVEQLHPLRLSTEEFKELVKNTDKNWRKEKIASLSVTPSVGDSLMLKMKFL